MTDSLHLAVTKRGVAERFRTHSPNSEKAIEVQDRIEHTTGEAGVIVPASFSPTHPAVEIVEDKMGIDLGAELEGVPSCSKK